MFTIRRARTGCNERPALAVGLKRQRPPQSRTGESSGLKWGTAFGGGLVRVQASYPRAFGFNPRRLHSIIR